MAKFTIAIDNRVAEGAKKKPCLKERRSKTWTGACIISGNCNYQCKHREGDASGSCHYQFPGFACFCYFCK